LGDLESPFVTGCGDSVHDFRIRRDISQGKEVIVLGAVRLDVSSREEMKLRVSAHRKI